MISMTSWKKRLRRMLFLDELDQLVGQTPKMADLGANSATATDETAGVLSSTRYHKFRRRTAHTAAGAGAANPTQAGEP